MSTPTTAEKLLNAVEKKDEITLETLLTEATAEDINYLSVVRLRICM